MKYILGIYFTLTKLRPLEALATLFAWVANVEWLDWSGQNEHFYARHVLTQYPHIATWPWSDTTRPILASVCLEFIVPSTSYKPLGQLSWRTILSRLRKMDESARHWLEWWHVNDVEKRLKLMFIGFFTVAVLLLLVPRWWARYTACVVICGSSTVHLRQIMIT